MTTLGRGGSGILGATTTTGGGGGGATTTLLKGGTGAHTTRVGATTLRLL